MELGPNLWTQTRRLIRRTATTIDGRTSEITMYTRISM